MGNSLAGTKTLFQEQVNIGMEAIANAGDITITGDRKLVTVIRKTPGATKMHDIDLTDINVMQFPYFICNPMNIFMSNHKTEKRGEPENGYNDYYFAVIGNNYFYC
jgi:hypothetical protein